MSVTATYPYTTPSNYTYDTDKIEVTGGVAKLKLNDLPNQVFTEDFDNDTGFTYDSDKTEFSGGQVQQKNQQPSNSTFGASYTTDINGSFGSGTLTGSGVGSPVITGNRLDLTGNTLKYVDYDANLNADSQQTGCIRFKLTPNYSGAPTGVKGFIGISKQAGFNDNGIKIYQSSTLIFIQIANSAAGSIVSNAESWSPVSGTTYEIELNYDLTAGATRLFIDGVQKGPTQTGTGTRSSDIGLLRIGSDISATQNSDFYIEDLIIFDTVQHTSNYTPGYTVPDDLYLSDNVTLPEMEYTGAGTLQAFPTFATTEGGTPKYTLQIGRSGNYLYWNGSAWVTSDGTYSQANDATTFNANSASLAIEGEIYGQFKIHFDTSSSQSSVDQLVATLTGQTYPDDDPTIEVNETLALDELLTFVETSTKSGSDEIKHILKKGSDYYYWSGSAWAVSDGTYSQSNTATEITTNIASFTTVNVVSQLKSFLHSNDGSTTPELDQIVITYDFGGDQQDELSYCEVYFYSRNDDGTVNTNDVMATLSSDVVRYKDNVLLDSTPITVTPRADGYVELVLIENVNMQGAVGENITYTITQNGVHIATISVPDQNGALLWDIEA